MKRFFFAILSVLIFSSVSLAAWPNLPYDSGLDLGGGSGTSDQLRFYTGLTSTDSILSPTRAASGTTGTFTRASSQYITNWEGGTREVKSGSVAVEGSRVVTNLLTYSEDLSNAAWIAGSGGSKNAITGELTSDGTNGARVTHQYALAQGGTYRYTVSLKAGSLNTASLRIYNLTKNSDVVATTNVSLGSAFQKYSVTSSTEVSSNDTIIVYVYIGINGQTTPGTIFFRDAQLENVTGQSNTNPGEYVKTTSAAVSKCFSTQNGNTVDGNGVVTEATGAALPQSYPEWQASHTYAAGDKVQASGWWYNCTTPGQSGGTAPTWLSGKAGLVTVTDNAVTWTLGGRLLLGYVSEPASSNKVTGYGVIPADTLGSELCANGTFADATGWTLGTGWTVSGGTLNGDATTINTTAFISASYVIGKYFQITYTISNYVSGSVVIGVGGFNFLGTARSANGTYTEIITATNLASNNRFYFKGDATTGFVGSIDNVSVKEVQWYTGTRSLHNGSSFVQNITGLTLSGDTAAVLSIVTDETEIAKAGLVGINPTWKVYKLDNSAGSTVATVSAEGTTGNTNSHTMSAICRESAGTGYISLGGVGFEDIATSYYRRLSKSGNPDTTARKLVVAARANSVVYFLLPQLEELPYATSIMPTVGATATRAATSLSYPTGATIKQNKCTNYNVIPADSLGAELITVADDRTFDSDTGFWTKQTGWSIGGGVASFTPNPIAVLYRTLGAKGKVYEITFTITSITSQGFAAYAGGTIGTSRTVAGTYTERLVANANGNIGIRAEANANGSIDNISVKEVGWAVNTKSFYDGATFQQNITGLTLSGDQAAVLSIVDDTAELTAAGLMGYATTGKVYKLDNSAGSTTAILATSGTTGNTNIHTILVYSKRVGSSATTSIRLSGNEGQTTLSSASYSRTTVDNLTPGTTGRTLNLYAGAGDILYFILNQLEESATANPDPIITQGGVGYKSYGGTNLRGNDVTVGIEGFAVSEATTTHRMFSSYINSDNRVNLTYSNSTTGLIFGLINTGVSGGKSVTVDTVLNTSYKVIGRISSITPATVFYNGISGGAASNIVPANIASTFHIGTENGTQHFIGYLRNLRIYFKPLSDTKCKRLTTSSLFHDYIGYADNYFMEAVA